MDNWLYRHVKVGKEKTESELCPRGASVAVEHLITSVAIAVVVVVVVVVVCVRTFVRT